MKSADIDLVSIALAPRVVPGTVLVFDEFKAFHAAVTAFGWRYDRLAFSLVSKQAVVILR